MRVRKESQVADTYVIQILLAVMSTAFGIAGFYFGTQPLHPSSDEMASCVRDNSNFEQLASLHHHHPSSPCRWLPTLPHGNLEHLGNTNIIQVVTPMLLLRMLQVLFTPSLFPTSAFQRYVQFHDLKHVQSYCSSVRIYQFLLAGGCRRLGMD
jgi:hypothetical protein